jgi:hypothetical protein
MKGDETECMLLKRCDDMGVPGQPCLKVGNGGDVLALRERDGDVKKQRILISGMTFERMSLLARIVNKHERNQHDTSKGELGYKNLR